MKSIVDFTNELKDYFASKQALTNEAITRSKVGAHNLCKLSLAEMKSMNDNGTWTGNEFTHPTSGVKFTVNTDSNGNVTSIKVNGTSAVSSATFFLLTKSVDFGAVSTAANSYENTSFNDYIISDGGLNNANCYVFYNSSNQVGIRLGGNVALSNVMVYPMVRLATDPNTDFEPYAMTNRELTEDKNKDRNSLVNNITITGYTSSSNRFVCPCDGYVYSSVSVGGYVAVNANSGIRFTWGGRTVPDETAYFVQKGMQLQITDNTLPSAVVFRSF